MLKSYDLCGPNPNPMTVAEVDALKKLVTDELDFSPPVIVNIGAERGVSTMAFLEACPGASILSVDVGICETEIENLKAGGLNHERVIRLLGRSQVIGTAFPCVADFIFVDGDHSEAGVAGDIKAWDERLIVNGIMAFHDYIPEPIPPEIKGRVCYAVDKSPILEAKYKKILQVERVIAFRKMTK